MRRRRPSRTVTVYSTVTHNTHQDGAIREDTRDRAPEWTKLADALEEHDDEEIEGCNDDINTLLTFAGLFSAAVTAFNIETYKMLQPDSGDLSSDVLVHISQQLANTSSESSTSKASIPYTVQEFHAPGSAVRINVLWFTSLVFSLIAASLSILVKQWLRQYSTGKYSNPEEFVRVRHCRREGLRRWHVWDIVALLPVLLTTALVLFFIGLAEFLLTLDKEVGILVAILISLWLLVYAMSNLSPILFPDCPYITPLTKHAIRSIRRQVWQAWSNLCLLCGKEYPKLDKYYGFPGDEMGIRRDTTKDLPALISLDRLFMDDAFVDEVTRFCLRRMNGSDTLEFLRHFLYHRRAIHYTNISGRLSEIDFTRVSTRALVATTDALHYKLTQALSQAKPEILQIWAQDSLHYIILAIHHCVQSSRDLGPSISEKLSRLLTHLFMCGHPPTIKRMLLFLSEYRTPVIEYLGLDHIQKKHIEEILESAKALTEESGYKAMDLCAALLIFVERWIKINRVLPSDLTHALDHPPFNLLPLVLSKLAEILEREHDLRLQQTDEEICKTARSCQRILQTLALDTAQTFRLQTVLSAIIGDSPVNNKQASPTLDPLPIPVREIRMMNSWQLSSSPTSMSSTLHTNYQDYVVPYEPIIQPPTAPSLSSLHPESILIHPASRSLTPLSTRQESYSPDLTPDSHNLTLSVRPSAQPALPDVDEGLEHEEADEDSIRYIPEPGAVIDRSGPPSPSSIAPGLESGDVYQLRQAAFERPTYIPARVHRDLISEEGIDVLDGWDLEHIMPDDPPGGLSDLDISTDDWIALVQDIRDEWIQGNRAPLDNETSGVTSEWNESFFSKRGVELVIVQKHPPSRTLSSSIQDVQGEEVEVNDDEYGQETDKILPEPYHFGLVLIPLPGNPYDSVRKMDELSRRSYTPSVSSIGSTDDGLAMRSPDPTPAMSAADDDSSWL